jgi:hypothetical protein
MVQQAGPPGRLVRGGYADCPQPRNDARIRADDVADDNRPPVHASTFVTCG